MTTGDNRLPILAAEIKCAHAAARQHAGQALAHAIKAGEHLLEAKQYLKHGEWLPWLRDHTDIPERTAQLYMCLAKHKEVINTKSATVADLSIRGAVAEITKPKWPEKISERVEAVRFLPLHGHIRIGVREDAAGWDEVWVAPSYQHDAFFYVSHLWTARAGTGSSLVGMRRPCRADFVRDMVLLHLSMDTKGMAWNDYMCSPWTRNVLLFPRSADYVDGLRLDDGRDQDELLDLARGIAPSGYPVHVKVPLHQEHVQRPLCEMVFGNGAA